MFRGCFGKFPPDHSQEEETRRTNTANKILQGALPYDNQPSVRRISHSSRQYAAPTADAPLRQVEATYEHRNHHPTGHTSGSLTERTRSSPSTDPSRAALNASRVMDVQENVMQCSAMDIMNGLCLKQPELGRGTFGIVVPGSYRGSPCAVKVMLSQGLSRSTVREVLVGPRLVHPNIVLTYITRCAPLTHDFFDLIEGNSSQNRQLHNIDTVRFLEPCPLGSGDGFGDPAGADEATDPLPILHKILYALEADTTKMMVMVVQEHCDRGNLDAAIRSQVFAPTELWSGRLALRALLRTAAEVARGLAHLHDTGVVHGDLKPANIILTSAAGDRRGFCAKVADFGLSHVLPLTANSITTDSSCGSIPYMAPEAFRGKVSRATDVWSFGVVLWEMLTGQRPYEGMRPDAVVRGVENGALTLPWPSWGRHHNATPYQPTAISSASSAIAAPAGRLPSSAEQLVTLGRRCLSINPEDRPSFVVILEEIVRIEREVRAEVLAVRESGNVEPATSRAGPTQGRHQGLRAELAPGGTRPGIHILDISGVVIV